MSRRESNVPHAHWPALAVVTYRLCDGLFGFVHAKLNRDTNKIVKRWKRPHSFIQDKWAMALRTDVKNKNYT